MTHGSLFSGIGGFDLSASWLGWINVFQCEKNNFCQRVLRYHFPNSELYGDIKETDFTKYSGTIDVVSGGFPCQPFSIAGKRKGTDDDRYLWPEMLRAIREIYPCWVVAENVSGLLTQQSGMVFERVCADLENAGYKVQPFVIPACSVNAPHRRDRVWIIAHHSDTGIESVQQIRKNGIYKSGTFTYNDSVRSESMCTNSYIEKETEKERIASDANKINGNLSGFCTGEISQFETSEIRGNTTDSSSKGLQGTMSQYTEMPAEPFRYFPTQSPVCSRDDGLSMRLDGITFSKWRVESIKAYGNAIVPQVAYQIFKAIEEIETLNKLQ